MRESYCGLCDDCQLGHPGFLETVSRLKGYLDQVRANVWLHCFPGPDGFSLPEFRKGLEWFLAHTECPGCTERPGPGGLPHPGLRPGPGAGALLSVPGPGALRQVRPAPGAVSRRQDQPAPPPVEVQGQGIPPEAGRGEEVGEKQGEKGKRRKGRKARVCIRCIALACVGAQEMRIFGGTGVRLCWRRLKPAATIERILT